MAKAVVNRRKPEDNGEQFGPDLLADVDTIELSLTRNEVAAFLVASNRIGGNPHGTLRGEMDTIRDAILHRLGVKGREPAVHESARRYLNRDDLATGRITFHRGGAHV